MEKQETESKENLFDKIKDYIATNIELKKLTVIEKAVVGVSSLLVAILLGITFLFMLLFASMGLAIYLGNVLNNSYIGFFLVGLLYLIILIILFLMSKNYIKNPLINYFIAKIFK